MSQTSNCFVDSVVVIKPNTAINCNLCAVQMEEDITQIIHVTLHHRNNVVLQYYTQLSCQNKINKIDLEFHFLWCWTVTSQDKVGVLDCDITRQGGGVGL